MLLATLSLVTPARELVIFDASVSDLPVLLAGLREGVEAIALDPNQDGVEQVAAILSNYQDLDAIHLLSHGSAGRLALGNSTLTSETAATRYGDALAGWGAALAEGGDLLLYGCAVGADGGALVSEIAAATGADVAASDDLTGAAALGGDWVLEVVRGMVDAPLAFQQQVLERYRQVLADAMYWTNGGTDKIQRANLDGTEVDDLVTTGLETPYGIVISGDKMYWTDPGTAKIQRANLDGTSIEELVTIDLGTPHFMAIAGGKMYWTTRDPAKIDPAKIQRANLDGTGIEDLVTLGLSDPLGIAISGGKVYWTDFNTDTIQRANLDGTDIENLVTTGLNTPEGIAIANGKMYWTDSSAAKIQRANLDGTEVENLVTTGLDSPCGIAISGNKMYWTDYGNHTIKKANLDGTGVEVLLTSLDTPYGMAILRSALPAPNQPAPTAAIIGTDSRDGTTIADGTLTGPQLATRSGSGGGGAVFTFALDNPGNAPLFLTDPQLKPAQGFPPGFPEGLPFEFVTPPPSAIAPGKRAYVIVRLRDDIPPGDYFANFVVNTNAPSGAYNFPLLGTVLSPGTDTPQTCDSLIAAFPDATPLTATAGAMLVGGAGSQILQGSTGDDTLVGNTEADGLCGGDGNDLLRGGKQNDILLGGTGNDILAGDDGNDTLLGGADRDTFVLGTGRGSDVVLDYLAGVDGFGLEAGLSFGDLTVMQYGSDTQIRLSATQELLITAVGVNAGAIAATDFVAFA
jgi:Ca2+-binding RTX toxin-like protein